jgi:hypothetical protein
MSASFCAWYDFDRYFEGEGSDFAALPRDGMQVLLIRHPDGIWQMCTGHDFYFYQPVSGVWGHNSDSEASIHERYGEDTIVVRGRWTTREAIERYLTESRERIA